MPRPIRLTQELPARRRGAHGASGHASAWSGDQCAFAGGVFRRDGGVTAVGGAVVESMAACLSLERINCPDYDGTDADAAECVRQTESAACIDFEIDGSTYTGVEPLLICPS